MKTFGVVLLILLVIPAVLAFSGWLIMLVWGGLAHVFGFRTIGYWAAVLVSLALSLVSSFFKASK